MKLRGCPDSSAPAPSSSSSILWPTGAPGGLERGERRPSEKVSSRNRGASEGAHLGGSRAQAEAPGGPVQPSSPSPQGHAARGAPGLRQAPPGASPASPGPLGPPGPAGRLPLTLFRLLRFAPRLRSPDSALPSAKLPRKGKREGGRRAGVRGGTPPLPAPQLEQDLRGQHRPGSAPKAAGGGEEGSLWGWVWRGWGPAPSSAPRRAYGPGGAGRPWGAVPGGGGGGDAATAVAAAAVAFAGATASFSGRDAERASESGGLGARRTPQLDPSLQLQASAPPLPSQHRSQSPRAVDPELHAYWPTAVAVREGAPRERTTAGIPFPPQNPGPPPSPPLAPGSFPAGRSQLDCYSDRTHFPIGRWGLWDSPGGSPGKSECSAQGPGIAQTVP